MYKSLKKAKTRKDNYIILGRLTFVLFSNILLLFICLTLVIEPELKIASKKSLK